MYTKIVVGTDGSGRANQAVEHAADLARLCEAQLHLVQGSGSPVLAGDMSGMSVPTNPAEIAEACEEALAPLASQLRERGIDVTVHVLTQSGHIALCTTAEVVEADLIVVGNRGMTGARRFLGSVPSSVAHQAPCSVLIVATD